MNKYRSSLAVAGTLVAVGLLLFCTETLKYTPEKDAEAVARMAMVWVADLGGEPVTLTVCEDVAEAEAYVITNNCQVEHIIEGGGRADEDEAHHGAGCGGCPFDSYGFLEATLSGGPFTTPSTLSGTFRIKLGYDEGNIYDLPYTYSLACDSPSTPCTLSGQLEEETRLDATLSFTFESGDSLSETLVFHPTGPASCD